MKVFLGGSKIVGLFVLVVTTVMILSGDFSGDFLFIMCFLGITLGIPFIAVWMEAARCKRVINTFLYEDTVNRRLSALAENLHSQFEREAEILSLQVKDVTSFDDLSKRLKNQRENVARAKKEFWNNHALAEFAGFIVYLSYKNYLVDKQSS